jgi:transposase
VADFRLDELSAVSPYFSLIPGAEATDPEWRPVTVMLADTPEAAARLDGAIDNLGSAIPDLAAERLRYRLAPTGPVELAAHPLIGLDPDHAWRRIIDDHLHPLADAVRRQAQIGRRLLDGNIASSMAGSLTTLARTGQAPLATLIDRPWAQPEDLAPYGEWTVSAEGPRYVRNTCCGYEQLSEGWRCGDCSLARERLRS